MMVMSAFLPPCAIAGVILFCPVQCLHLASIIVALVFTFNEEGSACALSSRSVDAEGTATFNDVGNSLAAMAIAQIVLYCFYTCCMMIFAKLALGIYMMRKTMDMMK